MFLPTAVTYPETQGVHSYNDLTPRVGVAWDVFGTGKTSVKINAGKYLQAAQNGLTYGALRPTGRLTTTVTRTWTDANNDFIPDCDLLNPLAQDRHDRLLRADQHVELRQGRLHQRPRPGAPQRLGRPAGRLAVRRVGPAADDAARLGRGRLQPAVAEQLHRRRQLANGRPDFGTFSFTAPDDPRLPRLAGRVLTGTSTTSTRTWRRDQQPDDAGRQLRDQITRSATASCSTSARGRVTGWCFRAALSTGTTRTDSCSSSRAVAGNERRPIRGATRPPDWSRATRASAGTRCRRSTSCCPERSAATRAVSWRRTRPCPRRRRSRRSGAAVERGANVDRQPRRARHALWRSGQRVRRRLAKILRFGRTRTNVGFDIYNVLNPAAVLSYNQTSSADAASPTGQWLVPTAVMQPRFLKFSVQVDF